LVDVGVAAQGDTEIAHRALGDLLVERFPQAVLVEDLVGAGVELVEVHVIGSKRPQRPLQLSDHLLRRPVIGSDRSRRPTGLLHGLGVKSVAELGGDHAVVPLLVDRLADEGLGQVVAVALGGVHQVHAEFSSPSYQPVHLVLGEPPSPLAAELPGSDTDHRDPQPRLAQPAVLHGRHLQPAFRSGSGRGTGVWTPTIGISLPARSHPRREGRTPLAATHQCQRRLKTDPLAALGF
jgi:hypothetical protein